MSAALGGSCTHSCMVDITLLLMLLRHVVENMIQNPQQRVYLNSQPIQLLLELL